MRTTVNGVRVFAKLKKFQKSKKTWIELTPPTHPPSKLFWNPSLTWTEHSNHNNQQLVAMHVQTEYTWYSVVPALGDLRRERPPAVYGHVINVPIHLNVPIRPSDERPPAMYGHFSLVPRVSVHGRYYCTTPKYRYWFRAILGRFSTQKNIPSETWTHRLS